MQNSNNNNFEPSKSSINDSLLQFINRSSLSDIPSDTLDRLENLHLENSEMSSFPTNPNYAGMIHYLKAQRDLNTNFVARDKHDIDFLYRMSQDYESGKLPPRSKEAWEERVYLFYMVAEYGWPTALEKNKEHRIRNFGVEFIPSSSYREYSKRFRDRSRSPLDNRDFWKNRRFDRY